MSRPDPRTAQERTVRPIVVHNTLLDGIPGAEECPCFVLDTIGLAPDMLRAECDAVAALQSIAPVFTAVVFSDLPVFDLVRRHGWPLEHFPSLAHRERTVSPAAVSRYLEARRTLLGSTYQRATLLTSGPERFLAAAIAEAVGVEPLLETAYGLAGSTAAEEQYAAVAEPRTGAAQQRTGDWARIVAQLAARGRAVLASDGGEVLLELPRTGDGHLFVHGSDTAAGRAGARRTIDTPDTATICALTFDPGSSLEFESAVYAAVARRYGARYSVVLPWRSQAMLLEDSMRAVDLAIELLGEQPMVLPEYAQRYAVFAGSREYTWEDGLLYGAARRVARTMAFRR